MPILIVFGAGALAGLWLRSEADTNGSAFDARNIAIMGLIGGGAYLTGRYVR